MATAQHTNRLVLSGVLIEIVAPWTPQAWMSQQFGIPTTSDRPRDIPSFLTCSADVPPKVKHWNDEQSELWQSGRWISRCPYRGFRPRDCSYLKMANRKGLQMQKGGRIWWHFPSWQWPPRTMFQTLGLGSLCLDVLHCNRKDHEHMPDHCP